MARGANRGGHANQWVRPAPPAAPVIEAAAPAARRGRGRGRGGRGGVPDSPVQAAPEQAVIVPVPAQAVSIALQPAPSQQGLEVQQQLDALQRQLNRMESRGHSESRGYSRSRGQRRRERSPDRGRSSPSSSSAGSRGRSKGEEPIKRRKVKLPSAGLRQVTSRESKDKVFVGKHSDLVSISREVSAAKHAEKHGGDVRGALKKLEAVVHKQSEMLVVAATPGYGWEVVDEMSSKSLLSKATQKLAREAQGRVVKKAKVAERFVVAKGAVESGAGKPGGKPVRKAEVQCFKCQGFGHFRNECTWDGKSQRQTAPS